MASPSLTGDRMADPTLTCHEPRQSPLVNGVRIDPVSPNGLLTFFDACLGCNQAHVAHFLAADPTVMARRDPRYRRLLNQGELNLPDGMGVVWATRLFGFVSHRVSGTEGLHLVARWGLDRGLSHYLFGGTQQALAACGEALKAAHPGIRIVGAESPPFRPITPHEMAEAASRIRDAGADVVWVGLGTPKQDLVAERLRRLGAAPVIASVGAAFDFIAGTKPRAPRWMRRSGLEWLHRLASEPGRLWKRYLLGNPAFAAGVLTDFVTWSVGRRLTSSDGRLEPRLARPSLRDPS
jgi:N-acetylglucosaminyldiphosphoundecaprenol N-acetyl-beta-D-mannosaminyltransferase